MVGVGLATVAPGEEKRKHTLLDLPGMEQPGLQSLRDPVP